MKYREKLLLIAFGYFMAITGVATITVLLYIIGDLMDMYKYIHP